MTARTAPLDLAQFEGHTPGPWKLTDGDEHHRCNTSIHAANGEMLIYHAAINQRDQAAIRLIAAAPALLTECKRLSADLKAEEMGQDNLRRIVDRQREQTAALREALRNYLDADVSSYLAPEGRERALHYARSQARVALQKISARIFSAALDKVTP